MEMDKYFLGQIKRTNGTVEKGIVVKDTLDAVKQSYHAYLGAYAYDHDPTTDYVATYVVDSRGVRLMWEVWDNTQQPEPEEPEA